MHTFSLANQDLGHRPKKGLGLYSDMLEDKWNFVISLYQDLVLQYTKGLGFYSDLLEDDGNILLDFDWALGVLARGVAKKSTLSFMQTIFNLSLAL